MKVFFFERLIALEEIYVCKMAFMFESLKYLYIFITLLA